MGPEAGVQHDRPCAGGYSVRRGPAIGVFLVFLVATMTFPPIGHRPGPSPSVPAAPQRAIGSGRLLASRDPTCGLQSLLPAYFYPGPPWQSALDDAAPGSTIIVNPSSGPGNGPDPQYEQVVDAARSKGVHLLGYINTFYTATPLGTVEQQVDEYRTWYGITDIYFDDVSRGAVELGYYQWATGLVRSVTPGAEVMLNPGTYPDQSYLSLGDVIVDFEGTSGAFMSQRPPSWVYDYPATMFASQISAVPQGQVTAMLDLAAADHSSYVYLTDETDPAVLYEQLPSYWSTEVGDLTSSLCAFGDGGGYWLVASDGGIFSFGDAAFHGSTGAMHLNAPIVGMAATPDGGGYWLVASDGGIFSFGDAAFHGSTGAMHLNAPIVGMAATPDGGGYWLVASDGGIFSFGDAAFHGSTGAMHLNAPIVGMAATPDGGGYWLVASDGGIFSFGDAAFHGSTGAMHLNAPIVGMAATPDGGGYWLVASDGGIFSFGDAAFHGSTGAMHLNAPIVGMAATPDGGGYWLVASDGGIFSFGDAAYEGSTASRGLSSPIVAVG